MPFSKGYIPWNKGLDWKPKSAFKKGYRASQKTEFNIGIQPWNFGTKGVMPSGKARYNYKGGKPNCLDCSVKLADYSSKRCKSCVKKGERSSNWKGGITPQSRQERLAFRKNYLLKVFERDKYTCQFCLQVGVYLQVDHIKSWAGYPELRFNLDNCRTLCMKCHYKLTFGKEMPLHVKVWGYNYPIRK